MMATPSYPPTAVAAAAPLAVVSPHFCVGHPVDLIITRKMMTFKAGTFTVADVNENIVFNIQGKALSLHDRRLLLDAAGNPLLTYQQKVNPKTSSLSLSLWSLSLSSDLKYIDCRWWRRIEDGKHSEGRAQIRKIWFLVWENRRYFKWRRSWRCSWLVTLRRSTVISELKATGSSQHAPFTQETLLLSLLK